MCTCYFESHRVGILTATRGKHYPALHNINITLPENIFVTEKLSLILKLSLSEL